MKRIFDFTCAFLGLVFLSPLILSLAIIVKLSSSGPVFFTQIRVGQNALLFKMFKFRSMFVLQESDSTISIKGDMRITKIGNILRKYKLDELPALWNVLVGEMSLVGPRPDVPGYADVLVGEDRKILELKPGITGAASLKYANEEELLAHQEDPKRYNDEVIYPEKVRLNLDYYHNNNLWIDIKIIFATIFRTSY
jgi:lipopolysaccharide/colanic/teichoic acid biosynthesis glycosyltransferase